MEVYKEKEVVIMRMSMEEAIWLRGIMQNPIICGDTVDDVFNEDSQEKAIRERFFNATKEAMQ